MSNYHIDQLGRIVELVRSTPLDCTGCLYRDAYKHCHDKGERPLDAGGRRATCTGGIFVEVTHE